MNLKGSKMWRIINAAKLTNFVDFFFSAIQSLHTGKMQRTLTVTILSCQLIRASCCIIEEPLVSRTWPWQRRDGGRAGRQKNRNQRAKCLHRPDMRPSEPWHTRVTDACVWHDSGTQWRATTPPPQSKWGQFYSISQQRDGKGSRVDNEPKLMNRINKSANE